MSAAPRIVSVNVGGPRTVSWRGREVTTGIWKSPVTGPVPVAGTNVAGDDQADRRVHGGPDKAVYAYAVEDYEWWANELGDGPLAPGTFGENLTTAGIDLTGSRIGDRWTVGDVVLEVSQPRQPCYKLALRMNDDDFPDHFTAAGRPGAYLRIVHPGTLAAGDAVEVVTAAEPHISVGDLADGDLPIDVWETVAHDDRVPAWWRRTAARVLDANAST